MSKSTVSTKVICGMPCLIPNVTQDEEGFYISYNNYDQQIYGSDTTAIVFDRSGSTEFMVLNGDHRKELEGKSLEEAKEFFRANPEIQNKYSTIS